MGGNISWIGLLDLKGDVRLSIDTHHSCLLTVDRVASCVRFHWHNCPTMMHWLLHLNCEPKQTLPTFAFVGYFVEPNDVQRSRSAGIWNHLTRSQFSQKVSLSDGWSLLSYPVELQPTKHLLTPSSVCLQTPSRGWHLSNPMLPLRTILVATSVRLFCGDSLSTMQGLLALHEARWQ